MGGSQQARDVSTKGRALRLRSRSAERPGPAQLNITEAPEIEVSRCRLGSHN